MVTAESKKQHLRLRARSLSTALGLVNEVHIANVMGSHSLGIALFSRRRLSRGQLPAHVQQLAPLAAVPVQVPGHSLIISQFCSRFSNDPASHWLLSSCNVSHCAQGLQVTTIMQQLTVTTQHST